MINGEMFITSDNAVHLGHTILSSDRERISLTAKSSLRKSFNSFKSNLVIHTLLLMIVYLNNFVAVFMVHHYGI